MAWTSPRTWTIGEKVTKAIMDLHIRDNLDYLKGIADIALQIVARQGGNAYDWSQPGTNDYSPLSNIKVQVGSKNFTNINTASGSFYHQTGSVTFPVAFANNPIVFTGCLKNGTNVGVFTPLVASATTTTLSLDVVSTVSGLSVIVMWIAIGDA